MKTYNNDISETKRKILDAALEVFGEKGFERATVREICKKADVNIALINYHFRDKKGLYHELATGTFHRIFSIYSASKFLNENDTPEIRLKNIIRMMLFRMLGSEGLGNSKASRQLVSRELTNPTEILDVIIHDYINEVKNIVFSCLKSFLPDADENRLLQCTSSIIGQCMHLMYAGVVMSKIGFKFDGTDESIEEQAEHIYRFSLQGLKGLQKNDSKGEHK